MLGLCRKIFKCGIRKRLVAMKKKKAYFGRRKKSAHNIAVDDPITVLKVPVNDATFLIERDPIDSATFVIKREPDFYATSDKSQEYGQEPHRRLRPRRLEFNGI